MSEAVHEAFPDAKYQRCVVHFYRNVFSATPRARMTEVAAMLKAIHAQESKEAAREKAQAVVRKLQELKLKEAAKKVEAGIEETLVYMDFPTPIGRRSAPTTLLNAWTGRSGAEPASLAPSRTATPP